MLTPFKKLFFKLGFFRRQTGLIPQPRDERDYQYVAKGEVKPIVDLRDKFPTVTNQNGFNSCTAHAVGAMWDYLLKYKKDVSWVFNSSEAYLWYWSRERINMEDKNSGAILRDVFKAIQEHGFVPERFWDYSDGYLNKPDREAQLAGAFFLLYLRTLPEYRSLNSTWGGKTTELVKNALSNEYPVVFGIYTDYVFQHLKKDEWIVDTIEGKEDPHAMVVVGYTNDGFIVRNSWGENWGNEGHCIIDFDLFDLKAFDCWTLM